MGKEISVVIPCYNENRKGNLMSRINSVYSFLKCMFSRFDLILVDDGSCDNTYAKLLSLQAKVPEITAIRLPQHMGKGYALREGMKRAVYEIILFMDADLAVPLWSVISFYEKMEKGTCLVGERKTYRQNSREFPRNLVSVLCSFFVRKILHLPVRDSQCGFKMFYRPDIEKILPSCTQSRYMFDAELLYRLSGYGIRIIEEPVYWKNGKQSSVRIKDWFLSFFDLIQIRLCRDAGI